jgi:hypothetical protein
MPAEHADERKAVYGFFGAVGIAVAYFALAYVLARLAQAVGVTMFGTGRGEALCTSVVIMMIMPCLFYFVLLLWNYLIVPFVSVSFASDAAADHGDKKKQQ